MYKLKKQNGITLIALIITIIVMLILVAVTISVALNGGIFNNATDAKAKTQREIDREELISAMVGAYDNTGSFATSNVWELPRGAKWCNEDIENKVYADFGGEIGLVYDEIRLGNDNTVGSYAQTVNTQLGDNVVTTETH